MSLEKNESHKEENMFRKLIIKIFPHFKKKNEDKTFSFIQNKLDKATLEEIELTKKMKLKMKKEREEKKGEKAKKTKQQPPTINTEKNKAESKKKEQEKAEKEKKYQEKIKLRKERREKEKAKKKEQEKAEKEKTNKNGIKILNDDAFYGNTETFTNEELDDLYSEYKPSSTDLSSKIDDISSKGKKQETLQKRIDDTLDLHEYKLKDAIKAFDLFINMSKRNGYKKIRVITGKGLHSKNGIAQIRNSISENLLELKRDKKIKKFHWDKKTEKKSGAVNIFL